MVEMVDEKQEQRKTQWYKMGVDSLAKNTPNAPKIYLPNLSAQAQKFGISMKKGFIGRPESVLWEINCLSALRRSFHFSAKISPFAWCIWKFLSFELNMHIAQLFSVPRNNLYFSNVLLLVLKYTAKKY